jgi:hypothetical protein
MANTVIIYLDNVTRLLVRCSIAEHWNTLSVCVSTIVVVSTLLAIQRWNHKAASFKYTDIPMVQYWSRYTRPKPLGFASARERHIGAGYTRGASGAPYCAPTRYVEPQQSVRSPLGESRSKYKYKYNIMRMNEEQLSFRYTCRFVKCYRRVTPVEFGGKT